VLLSPHVLFWFCNQNGFALFFFPGGSEENELHYQYVKEHF
jgi:hypothetical protein